MSEEQTWRYVGNLGSLRNTKTTEYSKIWRYKRLPAGMRCRPERKGFGRPLKAWARKWKNGGMKIKGSPWKKKSQRHNPGR